MHHCKMTGLIGNYGPAATNCHEDDRRRYIIDNGEYVQQVNYCPECGTKAPMQIPPPGPGEDLFWRHFADEEENFDGHQGE